MTVANSGPPLLPHHCTKHERLWHAFVSNCEEESTLTGRVLIPYTRCLNHIQCNYEGRAIVLEASAERHPSTSWIPPEEILAQSCSGVCLENESLCRQVKAKRLDTAPAKQIVKSRPWNFGSFAS